MEIRRYIQNVPVKREELAERTVESEAVAQAIQRAYSRIDAERTVKTDG